MLNGQDVLLRLDVQGVATMRKLLGQDVVLIFMVAESEMALVK
jgi:guanylate kinase